MVGGETATRKILKTKKAFSIWKNISLYVNFNQQWHARVTSKDTYFISCPISESCEEREIPFEI